MGTARAGGDSKGKWGQKRKARDSRKYKLHSSMDCSNVLADLNLLGISIGVGRGGIILQEEEVGGWEVGLEEPSLELS